MSTITAAELSEQVHALASPQFEGRYTGSEGQRMAAEYIRDAFIGMGIGSAVESKVQPYFQPFVLHRCYWKEQQLMAGDHEFERYTDFTFLDRPASAIGTYPVVFAGFGIDDSLYSDYAGLDVKGKLVMAFTGEPRQKDGRYLLSGMKKPSRHSYHHTKMNTAREKGAAGLVIVGRDEGKFNRYVKSSSRWDSLATITYPGDEPDKEFISLYLRPEAAATALGTTEKGLMKTLEKSEKEGRTAAGSYTGSLTVNAEEECYPLNTENVIGIVRGTDLKSQAVVVVAHYDHLGKKGEEVYFGADDNASGVSALLEIAEAFATMEKEGIRPRRTVVFLAVSAEELGLYGSRFYSENPLLPLDSTYACINIDMIGRVGRKHEKQPDYVSGYAYIDPEILQIARMNNEKTGAGLEFMMEFDPTVNGGSDHYYFASDSIPSLFYFEGIHKDYHEPGDTPDKILYQRMEGITRGIFGTVWELANREE